MLGNVVSPHAPEEEKMRLVTINQDHAGQVDFVAASFGPVTAPLSSLLPKCLYGAEEMGLDWRQVS